MVRGNVFDAFVLSTSANICGIESLERQTQQKDEEIGQQDSAVKSEEFLLQKAKAEEEAARAAYDSRTRYQESLIGSLPPPGKVCCFCTEAHAKSNATSKNLMASTILASHIWSCVVHLDFIYGSFRLYILFI